MTGVGSAGTGRERQSKVCRLIKGMFEIVHGWMDSAHNTDQKRFDERVCSIFCSTVWGNLKTSLLLRAPRVHRVEKEAAIHNRNMTLAPQGEVIPHLHPKPYLFQFCRTVNFMNCIVSAKCMYSKIPEMVTVYMFCFRLLLCT